MRTADGRLHIAYNEMGQGDNVLIKCPNGKVIVIDCGASRWDGNFYSPRATPEQLRAEAIQVLFDFLGDDQTVNALILTHADKDHCNEVSSVFDHDYTPHPPYLPVPKVSAIEALYFSGAIDDYNEGGTAFYLTATMPPAHSYAITVNQKEYTLNGSAILNSPDGTAELHKKSRHNATRGFVKILEGTENKPGALSCNVYILASNVTTYEGIYDGYAKDDPDAMKNRSSIVTMVIYGDKKLLLVGDATFHTEKFLKDTYGDKIKDVELLHVGHHASHRTSSSYKGDLTQKDNVRAIDFVSHVNPRYLAVSAAYDSGNVLKLPRWETIHNYINGATRLAANDGAKLHCWWKETEGSGPGLKRKAPDKPYPVFGEKDTNKYVLCTGTHGVIDFKYKEDPDGLGNITIRAYKVNPDGSETFLP